MDSNQRALGFALSAVLLWSTVATAFKITLNYLSPLQMVAAASAVSWAVLMMITWHQGKLAMLLPEWRSAPGFYLGVGLLNPAIYYLVLFAAYDLLPASQAQPLNYTWAIALTFMAAIFLGQKIRRRDWCAAALGYLGVLVIATRGEVIYPATVFGLVLIVCGLLIQRLTLKSFLPPHRWRGRKSKF